MSAQLALALPIPSAVPAPQRDTLPDLDAHPEAVEREQTLRMILDYVEDPHRFGNLCLEDGSKVSSKTRMIQYAAETTGASERSILRWLKRYKKGGLYALADVQRCDKGKSRFFEKYPQAKIIVATEYLHSHRSKMVAWESLVRQAAKLGIPQDEVPSYQTIRTWLDSGDVPTPIKILARHGERALNERTLPFLRRKYTDIPVNALWTSDHAVTDVFVRNDCFAGVPKNARIRLRFTCIMDMRSRKFVGYCWTPEGSSRSIAAALRMAVLLYGPCKTWYCDNGADFKCVARGANAAWQRVSNPSHAEANAWLERLGILARLGIDVQFCLKYHPQAKPIERAFRRVHAQLESLCEHYTTGNAYLRPDQTNAAMAKHDKLIASGDGDSSPLMPASEFIRLAVTWIEQEYHQSPHDGRGMDGRSPNQIFDEGYPASSRVIPEIAALDHLFWERTQRRVDASTVRHHNQQYAGIDQASVQALFFANETDVLFHHDPNDAERGIVTDLDGNVIARVKAEQLSPHSRAAHPMIADKIQERRKLRNAAALTITEIRRMAKDIGHVSALDALREKAALSPSPYSFITHGKPRSAPNQTQEPENQLLPGQAADRLAARLRRQHGNS